MRSEALEKDYKSNVKTPQKTPGVIIFKRLKTFTTVAVYLTTFMMVFLFFSSFVSGAVSGEDTKKVMGLLVNIFGDSTDEPTSLSCGVERVNKKSYIGDENRVKVSFLPSGAKTYPMTFSSSAPEVISVDEEGNLTYLKSGSAKITVTAKDGALKYSFDETCYGKNPLIDYDVTLKSKNAKVGQSSSFLVCEGNTYTSAVNFTTSDESILFIQNRTAYFVREGSAIVFAEFEDGFVKEIPVNVAAGTVVIPERLEFTDDTEILCGKTLKISEILKKVSPEGSSSDFIVTSSDSSVAAVSGTNIVMKGVGQAVLTFTSIYNREFSDTLVLTCYKTAPTSLTISGADFLMVNGTIKFTAKHAPTEYSGDVVWSVVKGFGEIDKNGKLKAKFFGKITIRCQSTLDPSLYAEKTVSTKLYTNFYSFVRKLLGHFSLFALLGFGIWGCSFLITKLWYSLAVAPPICFICAALCEMFQSCTPGRYFTIADVFINFFGTLTGMFIAIILVGLFCLTYRLVCKDRFKVLYKAYRRLNIRTVFMKHKRQKVAA